jgi:ornithine cyclodeaminase/alanine dehydrogenase-like protein (mu-crystallin family)
MDRIVIAVATEMILVFGIGVMAGVIAAVALAIRKEDRLRSLTRQPPSAAARGARRLNGVGLRDITAWDAEEVPR